MRSRLGNSIKVNRVLTSIPPTMTDAIPRYSSVPAPGISISGNMPNTLVVVLIKMGRNRNRTALSTASLRLIPSRSASRAR